MILFSSVENPGKYYLYNPYHDEKGRFTNRESAVNIIGYAIELLSAANEIYKRAIGEGRDLTPKEVSAIEEILNRRERALYGRGFLEQEPAIYLFNPYHDKRGRFTTKERAVHMSAVIQNVGLRKTGEEETEDGLITRFASVREDFQIVTPKSLEYDKNAISRIHTGIAAAAQSLRQMDVNVNYINKIVAHTNFKRFATVILAGAGGLLSMEYIKNITAAADPINRQIDLSPELVKRLTSTGRFETVESLSPIGHLVHEMYHLRDTGLTDYIDNHYDDPSKWSNWADEGLAELAAIKSIKGMLGKGFTIKRGEFVDWVKKTTHPGYAGLINGIYSAAFKYAMDIGDVDYAYKLIDRWVANGDEDAFRSIGDVIKEEPGPLHLEYKLFNPYHDEKGRFTSKERAISFSAEKDAVGITGQETAVDKNGITTTFATSSGELKVFTPEKHGTMPRMKIETQQLHEGIGIAASGLKNIGVDFGDSLMTLHNNIEDFNRHYTPEITAKAASALGIAVAAAYVKGGTTFPKVIHISPKVTERLTHLIRFNPRKKQKDTTERLKAIGIIAHELYHARATRGESRKEYGIITPEEGLAAIAQSKVVLGLKGFRDLSTTEARREFGRIVNKHTSYRRDVGKIFGAAAYIKKHLSWFGTEYADLRGDYEGKSVFEIVNEWVKSGDYDTLEDITDAFWKTRLMRHSRYRYETQDSKYKLFNPYHDERGRFTSKERATTTHGVDVSAIDDKEWAAEYKKASDEALTHFAPVQLKLTDKSTIHVPQQRVYIKFHGKDTPGLVARVHASVAMARESLKEIGVRLKNIEWIHAYQFENEYKDAIHWQKWKHVWQYPPKAVARKGFGIISLGPNVIADLNMPFQMPELRMKNSIKVIAHELWHIRDGEKGKLLDFTEEGLATVAAGLVAAMLAGGSRFLSDQFSTDQFWRGIKTGFPRNYTDAAELITLAASSMATNKKTTGKILNGWVRNGGVGTERAILDTLKKEFEFDDEDFEHMLENSDVNYKLFNPYHDERGRFTTKEGNRYFSGSEAYSKDVKDMEGTIESAAKKNKFGKPNIFFFGKQSDYAKEVCRDMGRSDRSCRNYVGKNTYAAHRGGKVYISQALLAMHKRDRDGANYLGVHEVFHSRKRKGGGRGCKVFKNKYDNSTVTIVEEGITDMLARRFTGLPYNRGVGGEKPPYRGHMGALAFLALNATGGNRDAAWKLLNDIHYDIDNLSNINNLLSKSFIGADGKSKTKWSQKDRYGAINNLVNHPEYGERALAILFGG